MRARSQLTTSMPSSLAQLNNIHDVLFCQFASVDTLCHAIENGLQHQSVEGKWDSAMPHLNPIAFSAACPTCFSDHPIGFPFPESKE